MNNWNSDVTIQKGTLCVVRCYDYNLQLLDTVEEISHISATINCSSDDDFDWRSLKP